VFSFGDAAFHGSLGNTKLNAPIVGMAATPDGGGYWLVGSDGGVFSFGDAHFYGSEATTTLNAPVVGIAATPDGGGYRLAGADGGVFTFGDARYWGSAAGRTTGGVVGLAAAPNGTTYRLFGADERAYAFTAPSPPSPPPPPPPPAAVQTHPVATLLPVPRAARALKIRMTISWTWNHRTTRISRIRIGSMPGRSRLAVQCRGRGCPRRRAVSATGRRGIHRLLRWLTGTRYRAGDALSVSLTAPGYRAERARISVRDGRLPLVRAG
jgi:hypothetical protein